MAFRLLNKCTTALTLNLDGKDVTIPAGGISEDYKKAKFSFQDQKLINACLLIPIEARQKLPTVDPTDKVTTTRSGEPKLSEAPDRYQVKPKDKKTKSKTDK